ncbi:MAG: HAD family hydrolase [Phycisphaerae bacterium]|nr:HAD family hydrolase [Phycisphaerae bacterium]
MPIQAVIFDMDGTITEPYLDFGWIRQQIGMAPDAGPILEAMEHMSPDERRRAEEILHRCEAEAAQDSRLNDGAHEVLDWLAGAKILTAVLTRNSRVSVETVFAKHGLRFDLIRTREDGAIKPSPDPVLEICRTLGVAPSETWVVGDYLFDVQSGSAAGAKTVLLWHQPELPDWHDQADHVVRGLTELIPLFEASR